MAIYLLKNYIQIRLYEERGLNPYIKNQDMDNPYLASQYIENNTQQSTNRLNTKEQIDKEDKLFYK